MLNAVQLHRRRTVVFIRARFRRFIRNPVVVWFAGIILAVLIVIMLMILLLNIDVVGVDDLLADIPHDVTGVRDGFRLLWISRLTMTDCDPRTHLQPRSRYPWAFHQLGAGGVRRLQAAVVPWTFRPELYYLLPSGPPGGCLF